MCWFGFWVPHKENSFSFRRIRITDFKKKFCFYIYIQNKCDKHNSLPTRLPTFNRFTLLFRLFIFLNLSHSQPLNDLNDWQCFDQLRQFQHFIRANIEDPRWKWNKNSSNPLYAESRRFNENNSNAKGWKKIYSKSVSFKLQNNKRKKKGIVQLDCSRIRMTQIYCMRQFEVRKNGNQILNKMKKII